MTGDEALALGVRLVACKHFRPMPGMRDLQGRTWTPDLLWRWNRTSDVPDLADPATLGCLLALVREAWGRPEATALRYPASPDADGGWFILAHSIARSNYDLWITNCPAQTEAEALVSALEAKP